MNETVLTPSLDDGIDQLPIAFAEPRHERVRYRRTADRACRRASPAERGCSAAIRPRRPAATPGRLTKRRAALVPVLRFCSWFRPQERSRLWVVANAASRPECKAASGCHTQANGLWRR